MASIKKNFSLNLLYQFLNIGTTLITTPYIARVLGATNSGIYSYTYAIANYFLLFGMLGINNYGNRCIAFVQNDREKRSREFSEIYTFQILCSLLAVLVYVLYVFFLSKNKIVALIQLLYLSSAIFDVNWFFFGMEKFSLTVTRNSAVRILLTIGIFVFVKNESQLLLYTFIMAASQLVSTLILLFFLPQYVDYKLPVFKALKRHIKPMIVLFLPVIAISLYNIMDKIMLGFICEKAYVGYYDYSERIMQIPNAFITAIGTVMLPRMSNIAKNEGFEKAREYISTTLNYVIFFAFAMAFGIAAVSDNLIPIFLGSKYTYCILLVKLLCPIIVMKAWASVIRTQYLIPYCKDRIYVISVSLGAVVNLIINTLLIPKLGAVGATIGTVAAEFVVMFYQTVQVRKELVFGKNLIKGIQFLGIGVIMYVVVQALQHLAVPMILVLVVQVVIGAAIYITGSMLFNYKEMRGLINGFSRKK